MADQQPTQGASVSVSTNQVDHQQNHGQHEHQVTEAETEGTADPGDFDLPLESINMIFLRWLMK